MSDTDCAHLPLNYISFFILPFLTIIVWHFCYKVGACCIKICLSFLGLSAPSFGLFDFSLINVSSACLRLLTGQICFSLIHFLVSSKKKKMLSALKTNLEAVNKSSGAVNLLLIKVNFHQGSDTLREFNTASMQGSRHLRDSKSNLLQT